MSNLISRFCDFYLKFYKQSAVAFLLVLLFFGYFASRLKINSNQLDLLPQNLPEVHEAKKITEMVGGTGFFMITIKSSHILEGDKLAAKALDAEIEGDDKMSEEYYEQAKESYAKEQDVILEEVKKLKETSDILHEQLLKQGNIRFIQYKINLEFIQRKFLYFWQTEDLQEAFRRIGIKRDELIRKSDPFYIELENRVYKLELNDLVSKYTKIGKKEVIDDYYVSPDRRMMIMLVRPSFSMNDIEKSTAFKNKIISFVDKMDFKSKGIDIGYTGAYVQYVDAFESISDSLKPTLALSLLGITLILYFFVRRKRLIMALVISLVYSIIITFGITYFVIGQLNIITATFGGILAGFGIDFGLHYIFRFREEFWKTHDIYLSIKNAILHTGKAAISSASTTSAAFIVLMTSDFKGFSEFGIISAYGIIVTALCMFFLTSLQIIILYKHSDSFIAYLKKIPEEKKEEKLIKKINFKKFSRNIVYTTLSILLISLYFAPQVQFDTDSRHMLEKDIVSEVLKSEMHIRYDLAGDPLAIATETLDEAASLYEYFDPLTPEMEKSIGQTMSLYSFVPPRERQLENYKIIQQFKQANSIVKPSMIPAEYQKGYQTYQKIVNEKPYGVEELPEFIYGQFTNIPESSIKGYLTYIYPNVDKLYFTYDLDRLYNMVNEVYYPIIGKRTLRFLSYYIPEWEKKKRVKFEGSDKKEDFEGVGISEKEQNGILHILNNASEAEIKEFGFTALVNEEILKSRPFAKFTDIQKTKKFAKTTGAVIIMSKFTQIVEKESKWIILGTIILVTIILLLSFRNIISSMIALIPLVVSLIIIVGLLVMFNVKINYFNVSIFPIIIGYGINNGIFFYHRFLEHKSVSETLKQTGSAIIASSLTTIAGWGTLLIAIHPGLRSMGVVAVIGLSIMLVISVTFLPAVLYLTSHLKIHRPENT